MLSYSYEGENEGCAWQLTIGTYHYYEGHGTSASPFDFDDFLSALHIGKFDFSLGHSRSKIAN